MADSPFKLLIDTTNLWLPALTWLVARLSATRPGRKIEEGLKARLKWLRDPEAERAFQHAFTKGIHRYEELRGRLPAAQAIASVLKDVAEHDMAGLDRATILDQIFESKPDLKALEGIVRGHFGVLTAEAITPDEVVNELNLLITNCLRPAFRKERFFASRVGFAEITGLLEDILIELSPPAIDLETLRHDYCAKVAQKYQFITMQGISPKVHNRTIGIRMDAIFIPLRARMESSLDQLSRRAGQIVHFAGHGDIRPENIILQNLSKTQRLVMLGLGALGGAPIGADLTERECYYVEVTGDSMVQDGPQEMRFADADTVILVPLLGWSANMSVDIASVLSFPRSVICGDPGAGKSTLTAYISWAASVGNSDVIGKEASARLPIRIRAIELGDAIEDGRCDCLETYLIDSAGRFAPLIKYALAAGQALVMVDGLDEVSKPALRGQVRQCVEDFAADPAFADNQILITTRIVGYEPSGLTGTFAHFTLVELDDEQIATFVENWYRAIHAEMPAAIDVETEKKQLLDAILKKESIHRLARNPLLLTIIALIKWQGRALPDQRVLLYDAATQTLIRTWPLTLRRVELDELLIREWLAPVALYILAHSTIGLIDEYTLMEQMAASMRRLKSLTEFEAHQLSNQLLESISLHSGILLPRGTDADGRTLYGFLHQTFAEYLAAYHLAGQWEDGELDLRTYAHDPYWREVLLLMAGHLGTQRRAKAGQLLQAIQNLRSSRFEGTIHRDLLLAGRVLGDGVPVGPPETVELVLRDLLQLWKASPIPWLRRDALEVLGDLQETEYAPVLARLAQEDTLKAEELFELARTLGPQHFVAPLSARLDSPDPQEKLAIASLLCKLSDQRAIETLTGLLESDRFDIRCEAASCLIERGDSAAVAVLLDSASHWYVDAVGETIRILSQLKEPSATETLAQLLTSPSDWTRLLAAVNLKARKSDQGVAVLTELLHAADPQIRLNAAKALGAQDNPEARATLEEFSNSFDPQLALDAAVTLAELDDDSGHSALVRLARHEDRMVRLRAVNTLFQKNDPRGKEVLRQWLSSPDAGIRLTAATFLIKEEEPDTIAALRELLRSPNAWIQARAAFLLCGTPDPVSTDVLMDLVRSGTPQAIQDLIPLLLERDRSVTVGLLTELLSSEQVETRIVAAEALVNSEKTDTAVVLSEHLPTMLQDTTKTNRLISKLANQHTCVADVAYDFLKRRLTPTGEIRGLASEEEVEQEG